MPETEYERTSGKVAVGRVGRNQHAQTPKGKRHTDFGVYYRYAAPDVELFKTQLRVTARSSGQTYDLSPLVEQLTWSDDSASSGSGASTIPYINTQIPLTGTLQLRKPSLNQYKTLVAPVLSGSFEKERHGVSRWGALGVVVILEVGYGPNFVPVWAMRVVPTDGGNAEEVSLADGTWTLNLADDLQNLNLTLDDFKYVKGKKTRSKGWKCHEIAMDVCRKYKVPVKQLAKGTAFIELASADVTHNASPLGVIAAAYEQEMYKTGKAYVIRWAAPDKKHPIGALEILPMRRNPNLLRFRDQLTDALVTRSQSPDFATSILGRATLKDARAKGKHSQLKYHYVNQQAVRRFGWIHKNVDFPSVSSHAELVILTKRSMTYRLTPLRTAMLTHPGIATVRRGDAIRIDIPEEGYANQLMGVFGAPGAPKSKQSALALREAELAEPWLFGDVAPSAVDVVRSADLAADASKVLTKDTPVLVPVANQGIAFVTSVQHSASAESYSMEVQTSFIDTLDPKLLQAEIEANIRAGKALARTQTGAGAGAGGATGSGTKWSVTASAESDGGSGSCGPIGSGGMWYSELSTVPRGTSSDFAALGRLPCNTALVITNPANGRSVTARKRDVGAGSSFLPVMGLYPATVAALGLSGGEFHVTIQRQDGGALSPVRGSRA